MFVSSALLAVVLLAATTQGQNAGEGIAELINSRIPQARQAFSNAFQVVGLEPPKEGAESTFNQVQDAAAGFRQKFMDTLVRAKRETTGHQDHQSHDHHHEGHEHHHEAKHETGKQKIREKRTLSYGGGYGGGYSGGGGVCNTCGGSLGYSQPSYAIQQPIYRPPVYQQPTCNVCGQPIGGGFGGGYPSSGLNTYSLKNKGGGGGGYGKK